MLYYLKKNYFIKNQPMKKLITYMFHYSILNSNRIYFQLFKIYLIVKKKLHFRLLINFKFLYHYFIRNYYFLEKVLYYFLLL